jgi:lipopolysaccharide exporter
MTEGLVRSAINSINRWTHKFVPAGSLTRSVAIVAGGSALGQAISLAATPILTRLYTPADFGLMGVYSSLLTLVVTVASARYESAIPLPRKDRSAIDVLWLCFFLLLATASVCAVAVWWGGSWLFERLNAAQLKPYGWLLPLGVLGAGAYSILNLWAIRRRAYKRLAQTRLSQSVSSVAIGVALGSIWSGPLGLLLGVLAMQTAGITSLGRELFPATGSALHAPSLGRMSAAAYTYRQFPIFSTGAIFLCTLGMNVPSLLLTTLYGPEVTGWFNLAQRATLVPMTLVGTAISQIFLGEAAELIRTRPADLPGLFRRVTRRTTRLSMLVLGIGVLAPFAFGPILGAKWSTAGTYALFLAICCAGQLIVSPISSIVNLVQRLDIQLLLDALRLVAALLSLYVPYRLGGSGLMCVLSYSLAMTAMYVIYYGVYRSMVNRLAAAPSTKSATQ